MEFNKTKGSVSCRKLLYRGRIEQAVDTDFTLPDYCPDIGKLLKCRAVPVITMREVRANNICIEGVCSIRVLYIDELDKNVRCCERELPFSANVPVADAQEACRVEAKANMSYINCRAAGQRRLDIHGAFNINVCVYAAQETEFLSGAQGAGVRTRNRKFSVGKLCAQGRASFSLSEEMELPQGKPPVLAVIRKDACVKLTEAKPIANKLVLKGEAKLTLVYCSDDSASLETMEYSIPFSEFTDLSGVTEDCMIDVRPCITNCLVNLKTDSDGEYRRIAVELNIRTDSYAWQKEEIGVVCDAFSVERELALEKKTEQFELFAAAENARSSCSAKVSHEKEINEVIDCWCDIGEITAKKSPEGIYCSGAVNMCAIVRTADGGCDYIEKSCPVERSIGGVSAEAPQVNVETCVNSCGYTLSGASGLELRADIELALAVYDTVSVECVNDIVPSEQAGKNLDDCPAVVLYFAGANEELWDIARECGSSVELIKEENDIECEQLEQDTLLLVTVQ